MPRRIERLFDPDERIVEFLVGGTARACYAGMARATLRTLNVFAGGKTMVNAIDDAVRAILLNVDEILRRADSPLPLLLIFLGLLAALAGILAIFLAGQFSAKNPQHN